MKIIQLEAQNVKKLKAVEIRPDGNLVVIGGKNGAGKSSVLDSISYALAGKSSHPSQPVRDGEKKAKVVCDLGDLIVKRTITATGGGTLTIENKDGAVFKSPQSILDALVGKLTFDPLAFANMDLKKQVGTLKNLVGLDFEDLDQERKQVYEKRTVVNSEAKKLEAKLNDLPEYPNVPDEELSIASLLDTLQKTVEHNKMIREAKRQLEGSIDARRKLSVEIAELERRLNMLKVKHDELSDQIAQRKAEVDAMEELDEGVIKEKIAVAEETNKQVRENKERARVEEALDRAKKFSAELTAQLKAIDKEKAAALASAKFPVEGLSFDSDRVYYNGIPFNQASSAEQLRVSVAIGLAMNPKLKVLLIRDGSLLDEDNLALISNMAAEADAQVWIERVGAGKECQVIIEDGEISNGE